MINCNLHFLRYKEIAASEDDCKNNFILVRSGDVFVWIKINRDEIVNYQASLEKYSSGKNFFKTNCNLKSFKIHVSLNLCDYSFRKKNEQCLLKCWQTV